MNKLLLLFVILLNSNHLLAKFPTLSESELRRPQIPFIAGETLYIYGQIHSHIYDYIAFEYKAMKGVKFVSLHSLGGNAEWGIEIGRKIQELQLDTILEESSLCASACTYIFGSGKNRIMQKNSWLGFHGARIGGGLESTFRGLCLVTLDDGSTMYIEQLKGCRDHVAHWYQVALRVTDSAFDLLEKAGISTSFREYYYSLEDDEQWYEYSNILKKPDLMINSVMAMKYHWATQIQ